MSNLSDLTPGVWNVDPSHSIVGFTARHLMITKVRGRFTTFTGTVTVAENPLDSQVEATVDLGSVTTGDEQRDGHLKSADFFDVDKHPTMTFTSTGIKQDGGDYVLTGDLTVAGTTRSVDFELSFDGVAEGPVGRHAGGLHG